MIDIEFEDVYLFDSVHLMCCVSEQSMELGIETLW